MTPLQNRVTPFGDVVATPQRGLLTGNRGIIHDPATRTLTTRRWTTRSWIACLCDFRGRRRAVMAARSWTELFFLDEATAFAAGHRPCFYCRRAEAERFRAAWCAGNGLSRASAPQIDARLHVERLERRAKRLHPLPCAAHDLPDGAMIAASWLGPTESADASLRRAVPLQGGGMGRGSGARKAYVVLRGAPLRWSFDGYRRAEIDARGAQLITPPSVVRAFAAGYSPLLHPSAELAKASS